MKPFLKWTGNKIHIIDRIKVMLPEGDRLIEPFVGAGAVFANTSYQYYILNDANEHLMALYTELRRSEQVIGRTKELFTPDTNNAEFYNRQREIFNSAWAPEATCPAAVYLNRHCFNGLWRVNKQGKFNSPFGRYDKPYFPGDEMVAFRAKLKDAVLLRGDFEPVVDLAKSGDTIYCDPPFIPLTETANFTSYSANGFSADDHVRLRDAILRAQERGVGTLISNHDCPLARTLYAGADELVSFQVGSQMSCKGDNRKPRQEILALFKGR